MAEHVSALKESETHVKIQSYDADSFYTVSIPIEEAAQLRDELSEILDG